jgi:hypothetical protein
MMQLDPHATALACPAVSFSNLLERGYQLVEIFGHFFTASISIGSEKSIREPSAALHPAFQRYRPVTVLYPWSFDGAPAPRRHIRCRIL